jgi:hypothetical protein
MHSVSRTESERIPGERQIPLRMVQNLCTTQTLTTERSRQSDFCASLYKSVQNMASISYTAEDNMFV